MFLRTEKSIQNNRATNYLLSPLEKAANGQYLFPTTPCGVLPFYINQENKIVWGCIETNRSRVKSTHPPAGTQDIIVIKNKERFTIEVSKPLRALEIDCLTPFLGKNVSGQNYQEIISCLNENGYEVYLESMLATAIHETWEEHGTDLRIDEGSNRNLVINMYDFEPQTIQAKRGLTTQKVFAAHLTGPEKIQLNDTKKIEEKILINKGLAFYEKGTWCTLEELRALLHTESTNYRNSDRSGLTVEQINFIEAEFRVWASRIELIEKMESSILDHRRDLKISSSANAPKIPFGLMDMGNKMFNSGLLQLPRIEVSSPCFFQIQIPKQKRELEALEYNWGFNPRGTLE